MKEYNITVPDYTDFEKKLQNEQDYFKYMELLKEALPHYVLIISVGDTPSGPVFTPEHSAYMMQNLGLKINMQSAFRMPYAAVIDHGKLVFESSSHSLTEAVAVNGNLNNHKIMIYSGGMASDGDYGMNAAVSVDGVTYYGKRGFNFFLYNVEKDYIADMSVYDTYDNPDKPNVLIKPYMLINKIISNLTTGGGGIFCTFLMPVLPPTKYSSKQEQIMRMNQFASSMILENEKILKNIWDNKIFDFCNDFNTVEDLKKAAFVPESYEDINGIVKFKDYSSSVVNTRNGNRVTTNQPNKHKRAIFIVGCSSTFGTGADDAHTLESYLQRKLNKFAAEEGFIVYNYGYFLGGVYRTNQLVPIVLSLPIKKDDIVFLWYPTSIVKGVPFCDLTLNAKRPHEYGEIFFDMVHYSANGNRMIADGLFDFLKKHNFFRNSVMKLTYQGTTPPQNEKAEAEENSLLTKYKNELSDFFKEKICPKVGAIVMNANPFTYGHRYLVETALKHCDYLIIFVVEEDKSEIPFKDRFELVKVNVKDLSNVFVRPSGEFIISSKTFSEYFKKESIQEKKIDTTIDVTLFAKEIAPCLNISVRFAGKEPHDKITEQYNRDMAQILPQYNIEFMEIERKQTDSGEIINASAVRKLAKKKNFEKLKSLVPPATVEYLKKNYNDNHI